MAFNRLSIIIIFGVLLALVGPFLPWAVGRGFAFEGESERPFATPITLFVTPVVWFYFTAVILAVVAAFALRHPNGRQFRWLSSLLALVALGLALWSYGWIHSYYYSSSLINPPQEIIGFLLSVAGTAALILVPLRRRG